MIKITAPLFVLLPRKTKPAKRVIVNLNNYPNWSYFLYNDVKKAYCEQMKDQLSDLVPQHPVQLHFTLHRGTARVGDRANVLCVHEKFFCDALVHYGCLPDDTDVYIHGSVYATGEIDRVNPRVDILIIESEY